MERLLAGPTGATRRHADAEGSGRRRGAVDGDAVAEERLDLPGGRREGTRGDACRLDQHAPPLVEPIGDHGVGALARDVEEATTAIERDVVHAHRLLLEAVRSQRSGHGRQRAVGQQAAVAGDRKDRQRVRAVVADDEEAFVGVEGEVHRVPAAGGLPVERADAAGAGFDGEGVDLAAVAVDRVEPRAGRVDREEGWVLQSAEMLDVAERAGAPVDPVDVDAVALAVAFGRGVAADVGEACPAHAAECAVRPRSRQSSRRRSRPARFRPVRAGSCARETRGATRSR